MSHAEIPSDRESDYCLRDCLDKVVDRLVIYDPLNKPILDENQQIQSVTRDELLQRIMDLPDRSKDFEYPV